MRNRKSSKTAGVAPASGQKKRINPGPHKILQVGTNPNESEKTERIRTNPTLKFRVSLYFPHESNESEFCTVCAHKYYIRANGAKFGFVPSNINAGIPKKGGRSTWVRSDLFGFVRIRSDSCAHRTDSHGFVETHFPESCTKNFLRCIMRLR